MPKPPYELMYNQDDSALFFQIKQRITPAHVDTMVDEAADGGADAMLICVNAQMASYPSKVWQRCWENKHPHPMAYHVKAGELAEQCDYLQRSLERCRQRQIAPGASIRMNDMHGYPEWPDSPMFSDFYRAHPEWQLDNSILGRGYGARGLNYACPQVREHYLALIREVAEEYDVEILELDFLRFPSFFDRKSAADNCRTMTDFIGQVRTTLDSAGRRINLIPRVPCLPAGAYELGFDVQTWAQQDLIDGLTVGMFLNTGWEIPIDQFQQLVGPQIALYACCDFEARNANDWQGLPPEPLATNRELLRGFAANYLALGADGICIFNLFCSRERGQEPDFGALSEMRDLQGLRTKPRRHLLSSGFRFLESDLPFQIPVRLEKNETRGFRMLLAAAEDDMKVEVQVIFDGDAHAQDLWLSLNDRPTGCAREIVAGPQVERTTSVAKFAVPGDLVRDGWNELFVRCEDSPVAILAIDVLFG